MIGNSRFTTCPIIAAGISKHVPLSRYMLPHMPLMTAISGFNDRNMINQCFALSLHHEL